MIIGMPHAAQTDFSCRYDAGHRYKTEAPRRWAAPGVRRVERSDSHRGSIDRRAARPWQSGAIAGVGLMQVEACADECRSARRQPAKASGSPIMRPAISNLAAAAAGNPY